MALLVLCFTIIYLQAISCSELRKDGFMDTIQHGMKFASNYLGSESVALKVAEFVVRAFQTVNNQPKVNRKPVHHNSYEEQTTYSDAAQENRPNTSSHEASSPMAPLKHLVRLFGLQPSQISAVAVNGLVFVAQMISTFLSGPKRSKKLYNSEDPTNLFLYKNSRSLQDLISTAKNETLLDTIQDLIKEQGSEEETSCIQLLVCKITPIVDKMQKTVFGREAEINKGNGKGRGAMYRHLPTTEEINETSDICESRHKNCDLKELN